MRLLLLTMALILSGVAHRTASSQDSPAGPRKDEERVRVVGLAFLKAFELKHYDKAWELTAPVFRNTWIEMWESIRKPVEEHGEWDKRWCKVAEVWGVRRPPGSVTGARELFLAAAPSNSRIFRAQEEAWKSKGAVFPLAPERVPCRRPTIDLNGDDARFHIPRSDINIALRRVHGRWRVAYSEVEPFLESGGFKSFITNREREVLHFGSGMIIKVPHIPPELLPHVPGRKHEILELIVPIGGVSGDRKIRGKHYSPQELSRHLLAIAETSRDLSKYDKPSKLWVKPFLRGAARFGELRDILGHVSDITIRIRNVLIPVGLEPGDRRAHWLDYGVPLHVYPVFPDHPMMREEDPGVELRIRNGDDPPGALPLADFAERHRHVGIRVRFASDVSVERALRVLIRLKELKIPITLDIMEAELPGEGPPLALDGTPVLLGELSGPAGDEVSLTLWLRWADRQWGKK